MTTVQSTPSESAAAPLACRTERLAINWTEWSKLAAIVAVFVLFFFLPVGMPRFDGAVGEALHLTKWYAREHVLLCLVPAFFIAGAIGVFVSQASVMKYLGARANKALAYGVASVSGTILAVCSCTVLPLFAGIWRMGAGLGPATTFLYAGPAINALAIILTARHPGDGDRHRSRGRRHRVQRRHRPADAPDLPQGGIAEGRRRRRHAGTGSGPPALADGRVFRPHGRRPSSSPTGASRRRTWGSFRRFTRSSGSSPPSRPWA